MEFVIRIGVSDYYIDNIIKCLLFFYIYNIVFF